ncbi:MAG: efflux RND transporter permease subunit [Flavobacteriales bacterium]|nr:efflux RND transporter permease subunit [Flavobacteriales bacterium]
MENSENTPSKKENNTSGNPRKEKIHKEFGLSTLAINNRKTVFLLLAIIVIGGLVSYMSMPRESFPEIQIPEIYVGVPYPGNSPEIIQDKIIRPLENEINTIKNIDEINATAIQGYASIQIKFDFVVSPDEAKSLVEDALKQARTDPDFPKDLPIEPTVQKVDITQMPIINVNLSGNYPVDILHEKAQLIEDELEAIATISAVNIRGVQEQKLNIELRKDDAEAKRVSFNDVEQAIQSAHFNLGAGNLLVDGIDHAVIVGNKFVRIAQFDSMIIKSPEGNSVHLFEVADVYFGDTDTTSYARQNGFPTVMLDVQKRGGENILDAIDSIHAVIDMLKAEKVIPPGMTIKYTNDQSVQIRDQVSNLENSIIFGVILVTLVLLFFLGLRNALFVGVAIPLSMFMSFALLDMFDVTLNIMVLFSSVLSLGMLVDNGIVVVENIYRWMDEGHSRIEAAKKGVGEVAWPIIASTATTLGAFVPLALWPGMMGEFMQYLPITLMIVLGSSLFVALVINPVLTAVAMKVEEKSPNRKRIHIIGLVGLGLGMLLQMTGSPGWGNLFLLIGGISLLNLYVLAPGTKFFQSRVLPKMERKYFGFLTKIMKGKRSIWIFVGTIGLLFASFVITNVAQPKVLFFPENQPQYINVFIEQPVGTEIGKTNEVTLKVKEMVDRVTAAFFAQETDTTGQSLFIESVIEQVGKGTSDPMAGPQFGNTPHKARITIAFAEFQYRYGRSSSDYKKMLDDTIAASRFNADVKLVADKNQAGPPQEPAVNIEITGPSDITYNDLLRMSVDVKKYFENANVKDVAQLKLDVETGKAELPGSR